MQINIRYLKEKDIFEIQIVDKKLRSHFILKRPELNNLRTMLEKALLQSKSKDKGKSKD
ncbi:MAG: hypothetical protein WBB86_07010 [Candidatus Omnitrophota bacterium]